MLQLITGLGDSALLVPASALLLGYLLYTRSLRAAVIWIATLGLCAALTIALKIGFHACGATIPLLHLRSPSGHTSYSLTFYGCSALMIAAGQDRWARAVVLSATGLVVAAIALSRVVLHAHSTAEVVAGLVIGIACVLWFARHYFAVPVRALPWRPLLVLMLALALLTHGLHLDLETMIVQIARLFRSAVPACR